VLDEWKRNNWLLPDGRCRYYDRWAKQCTVYEGRPVGCRMTSTCPPTCSQEEWYEFMSHICDDAHMEVFGRPREHDGACPCRHPVLEIQVETSAVCNAKCSFCPYRLPVNDYRRGKFMEPFLFYKIADEVASIPEIAQFAFNGLGEPLLDPHIYEYVSYIMKVRPDMRTLLHTNGLLLEPAKLHATGLTNLVVSLNAVDARQHERVMGLKGKFDKVCAKIEEARKLPGWTVTPRATYTKDEFTEYNANEFIARWGQVFLADETNWIEHNRTTHLPADPNEGCYRALSQIYIAYNGDMHMCCMDAFGRIVFGNVGSQTIREVYNSEKYVEFREAHAENRALDVPECEGCTRC
jgi:uncharacterized Fe-S cluster-containing radical SAM superfamily protein